MSVPGAKAAVEEDGAQKQRRAEGHETLTPSAPQEGAETLARGLGPQGHFIQHPWVGRPLANFLITHTFSFFCKNQDHVI